MILSFSDDLVSQITMISSALSVIAPLNTSNKSCNTCFIMYKNPCLRAEKYTQIQTASVFVSVCHCGILAHLAFKDPHPRDALGYPTGEPWMQKKGKVPTECCDWSSGQIQSCNQAAQGHCPQRGEAGSWTSRSWSSPDLGGKRDTSLKCKALQLCRTTGFWLCLCLELFLCPFRSL